MHYKEKHKIQWVSAALAQTAEVALAEEDVHADLDLAGMTDVEGAVRALEVTAEIDATGGRLLLVLALLLPVETNLPMTTWSSQKRSHWTSGT